MGFDRGLTDLEAASDIFVARGLNDQSRDLALAGTQSIKVLSCLGSRLSMIVSGNRFGDQRGNYFMSGPKLTAQNCLDRFPE
jgi:hypothetical protein